MTVLTFLTFFSAISFLFFAVACLFTVQMKNEFKRYGLVSYRITVGVLQLLGTLGLVFGYFYSTTIQTAAAAGLSILMILGFLVRLKIRDTFIQSAPSFIYAVLNACIFALLLKSQL